MPRPMKAIEIPEVGAARMISATVPEIAADEVLVRVRATGVCGSDVAAFAGHHPFRVPPVITGHEVSGDVEAVGDAVTDLVLGDRVVVEPQLGCGSCVHCTRGDYNLCPTKRVLGTPVWPGSFAEYIAVPAASAYRIPTDLSYEEGALIEPLSVALHAVSLAPEVTGHDVAILGTGTVGLMLLLALAPHKPASVTCTDVKELNLACAREIGATRVVRADRDDVVAALTEGTVNGGVDVAYVAVSRAAVVNQALAATRPMGTVMMVATFSEAVPVELRHVQLLERRMIGSCMYTKRDFAAAIELIPRIRASLARIITHRVPLRDLPQALSELGRDSVAGSIKVMVQLE